MENTGENLGLEPNKERLSEETARENPSVLPPKPTTIQQPSRSFKPRIWNLIFTLLFFINIIFFGYLLLGILYTPNPGAGFIGVILLVFVLSIIDFIPVLLYVLTQHPQGIAKIIWALIFIILGWTVFYLALKVGIILHH